MEQLPSDQGAPQWPSPLGEQIGLVQIGPAGQRQGRGRVVVRAGRIGDVLYGPYLDLAPGDYSVVLLLQAAPPIAAGALTVEALWGNERIAHQKIDSINLVSGIVALDFAIPEPAPEGSGSRFEVRLHSQGMGTVTVESVDLRRRAPP